MQTIKTAAVVILLLAVLYAVYVVLNKPIAPPPSGFSDEPTFEMPLVEGGEASPYVPSSAPQVVVPSQSSSLPSSSLVTAEDPMSSGSSTSKPDSGVQNGTLVRPDTAVASTPDASAASESERPASAGRAYPDAGEAHSPGSEGSFYGARQSSPDLVTRDRLPVGPEGSPDVPSYDSPNVGSSESNLPPDNGITPVETTSTLFEQSWERAMTQMQEGKWNDSLLTLSLLYSRPDLDPTQREQLLDVLDPLAGRVIYSREHLLESPYEVRRGETLRDIAKQYDVPWQLLQKINGIENPDVLVPGTQLKVLTGPFRATVHLERKELTLFLGQRYAGRFSISIGNDPVPEPGQYDVLDKQLDRSYYTADGAVIPGDDPANPYGGRWIDLGKQICIHGTPVGQSPGQAGLGCISLSPFDADDVFDILSHRSKITITR